MWSIFYVLVVTFEERLHRLRVAPRLGVLCV